MLPGQTLQKDFKTQSNCVFFAASHRPINNRAAEYITATFVSILARKAGESRFSSLDTFQRMKLCSVFSVPTFLFPLLLLQLLVQFHHLIQLAYLFQQAAGCLPFSLSYEHVVEPFSLPKLPVATHKLSSTQVFPCRL